MKNFNYHLLCHSDPEFKLMGRIPKGDPSATPQGDKKGKNQTDIRKRG